MKIGIMVSDQCPEAGGGFTFEQGLMDSLQRLKSETSHELVMVGHALEVPPCLSGMPWVSLRPKLEKKAKIRREINRIFKKIVPGRRTCPGTFLLDFERAPQVQAADLDLIVYLHPGVSPFLDIPYIINVWDLGHRVLPFFPELSLAAGWEIRERHYRERLQRAAYIIAPNASFRQEMVHFYQVPVEKIRLLHHPTPNDVLRQSETSVEGASLDHLGLKGDFLLCPAQFWPHKNHILLLRMLKVLKEKYGYEPQLVLTGADQSLFEYAMAGNLSHIKQRVREMSLENQVIFAGFVSRDVLMALYRRASALVFPSFLGPENLPPLEAFALGCPVITSLIPGSRDQYQDAAIQIDPTSPGLWADAVQKLRQDSALRAALIAKGKVRARQFTSDDFLRGLFKIFDEFEPYRCNWTSALSRLPIKPGRHSLRPPTWEMRYTRPPL
jgi:glycosyltransferase involved in cell wall biosynthesis